MKSVAIIGAGALGLTLASMIKDDFKVTIFEKNNKIGKKILASGNGKCNFTNHGNYLDKYNNEFAYKIINKFNSDDTLNYFDKLGLVYKIDKENRAYPLSESSNTVLDVLKDNLKGVRILCDCKANSINNKKDKIEVNYNDKVELFDYLVCSSGSKASNLGSDSAYDYLENLNLKFSELKPSLCPILVKEKLKSISGVRVKALVTLLNNDKEVYKEYGEVLFKDNSLGGIVILNVSSYMNRNKGNYKISLDLTYDAINKVDNKKLLGMVNYKLKDYLESKNITNLKDIRFNVIGLDKFINSQVVSGGVSVKELNEDLSLIKDNRIYLGGELIDVDGMCGGYNLQFAFSSSKVIADSLKNKK